MFGYFSKTDFLDLAVFCALGGEEKASAPFNLGHGEGDNFTSFDPIFFQVSSPVVPFSHTRQRGVTRKSSFINIK